MITVSVDASTWDMELDAAGNFAMKTNGERVAQDVACALKTFQGELLYDETYGIPYFEQVLGKPNAGALVQGLYNAAALTVPEVVDSRTTITGITNRELTGTVEVIDTYGNSLGVKF